jgi:hypothetical protein
MKVDDLAQQREYPLKCNEYLVPGGEVIMRLALLNAELIQY